ncbi:MAG: S8 family serine peptidase, partial [Defluviitaleaceae bacterium]|nr:S8 family serine peptidase [Defluviitaleaceae bacterium]MCL2264030.1 S8 family serine peptidase [Defluviitaleaceae bacterium]
MHIVLLLIFLTTVPAYAQDSGLIGFEGEYALADDDTPVSVIVLFEHGPVAVQLYEAGVEGRVMPFGLAERLAADDHVLFRAEISALFGVGGYGARARTAAPFSEAVSIDRNAELARQFFANQEGSDDAHVERALGATDAEWRKSDRQDGVLGDGYSFSIDFEYRSAINGVSVTLPSNMVHALAGFDSVRAVFPDVKILPPEWDEYDVLAMAGRNPQGAAQGRATKRADEMHEMGYRGEGILVAVIDTGIYRNHAAFAGAFPTLAQMQERNTNITEGDTIDGIFYGRNFVTGIPTNNPSETHNSTEHGTHVAGIVAGRDSGGSQSVLGVAPDAQIIAYRVMGATGGTQSVLLAGINQTAYDKPDVVVMSLGVRGNNDPAQVLALAVNNITFAHPYITFVLAAGNDGPASSSIASPASAAKAITVGSVTLPATAGGAKTLTASSSRGPLNRTFEISPDVLGHGANVLSALPPWSAASGYGSRSGTSMA